MEKETGGEAWWEPREIPEGGLDWRIGPLRLAVERHDGEWRVAHREDGSASQRSDWSVTAIDEMPGELETVERFATSGGGSLKLTPRPADRSVVARPKVPLHVLAGEEKRYFVSAPVWVEVAAGDPARPLCEMPTRRLSDTWFGSSTRDGEVAYALRTHARSYLASVPPAAYRAVTPILIHNGGTDRLTIERMNLPVPFLSIYRCEHGRLWTEPVRLSRGDDNEMATFEASSDPPDEAPGAQLIGQPRQIMTGSPLVRAFGRLLRPFHEED